MSAMDFSVLFKKYLDETMTPEELRQWKLMLQDESYQAQLDQLLGELVEEDHTAYGAEAPLAQMYAAVETRIQEPRKVKPLTRYTWWAAAALVLIAGGAALLQWQQKTPAVKSTAMVYDVAPATDKAILTLGDGSSVTLDSAGHRVLQQGNTAVQQSGGLLQYDVKGAQAAVTYNTLTTPRGGQFTLVLPDGSQVWLNAASSIRYPTAFEGNERVVEIKGEAYFEVAANAAHPFKVKVNGQPDVEVLGTGFNINAYNDEPVTKTTLLQGRVRVGSAVLKPGEQAQAQGDAVKVLQQVDTDAVMAWRNGLFDFEGQSLKEVMRQLSRWYDIEVVYEGAVPDIVFGGKMLRNINLSQLLKILEDAEVPFSLEAGRKLVIRPTP